MLIETKPDRFNPQTTLIYLRSPNWHTTPPHCHIFFLSVSVIELVLTLPTAQRLYEKHLIGRPQRVRQIEHLFAVDEKSHVPAHFVLFVNYAEAQAGVLAVEVGEQSSRLGRMK